MKIIFMTLAVTLLFSKANAQDYRADFNRIKSTFNSGDKQLSFEILFRYYADSKTYKFTDSLLGRYVMQGNQYRYELANLVLINNNDFYVVVNNEDKKITIEKANQASPQYSFEMIDSLARLEGVTVSTLSPQQGLKGYKIEGLKGDISSSEVWFNPRTFRAAKIVLQYSRQRINDTWQQPRVEVFYRNYQLQSQANAFSEKKYLSTDGSQWRLSPAFSSYHLIDHTMISNQ